MDEASDEFMEAAATAFLALTPALANEIERGLPPEATQEERTLIRRQKAWAELNLAASRVCIEPDVFAHQVIALYEEQNR